VSSRFRQSVAAFGGLRYRKQDIDSQHHGRLIESQGLNSLGGGGGISISLPCATRRPSGVRVGVRIRARSEGRRAGRGQGSLGHRRGAENAESRATQVAATRAPSRPSADSAGEAGAGLHGADDEREVEGRTAGGCARHGDTETRRGGTERGRDGGCARHGDPETARLPKPLRSTGQVSGQAPRTEPEGKRRHGEGEGDGLVVRRRADGPAPRCAEPPRRGKGARRLKSRLRRRKVGLRRLRGRGRGRRVTAGGSRADGGGAHRRGRRG
jgi:hypothetical protein